MAIKARGVIAVLFLLLGIAGAYCLFPGNGEQKRAGEVVSVPDSETGVYEAASNREITVEELPSGVESETDSSPLYSPNKRVTSAEAGHRRDKFAQWFDGFEYSQTQEGASAVIVLDWSLKGPPEPTPRSDILVTLWANQKYDELKAFADERLRKDPTDKVGRLLKMENAALNGSVEEYYQRCADVLEVIKYSDTGHFSEMCAILVKQIKQSLYAMEARSPEALEEARASIRSIIEKEGVKGSTFPMRVENYIKALELDGYWDKEN